jgi:hypothetical protein
VLFDIVGSAAQLYGNLSDFVDFAGIQNVVPGQLSRVVAIAANHAQSQGFDLNNCQTDVLGRVREQPVHPRLRRLGYLDLLVR